MDTLRANSSNLILFFDTETTGKTDFNSGPGVHQPHVVQLASLLTDETGKERASLSLIIKPEGWTVPNEAAAIHGITTEIAEQCGVPLLAALSVFSMLCSQANTLVAHNIDFDMLVMLSAYLRADKPHRMDCRKFCTMHATTPVCKLPGKYGKFKWPKLSEAHEFLLKTPLEGAHDALADVRGCMRVYFALAALTP